VNRRGQFSIIAALLVAVVLVSTVIVTYSVILNNPIQFQPQVLSAIDEINFAIKQILGFTIGYYGSIIKVTGDVAYAHDSTLNYTTSGLNYIASTHPEWGISLDLTNLTLSTYWYSKTSYSTGSLDVTYNLTKLGIYGVRYSPSCELKVQIVDSIASNQARLIVTKDENEPLINLGKSNFNFFLYAQANSTWDLVNPSKEPTFENGTYVIETPPEIGTQSYVVQVADARGITVPASSFDHYIYTLNFPTYSSNWWNTSYSYRKRLTIMNNNASTLSSGYSVLLNVDTSSLVSAGKMLANGSDLRITYWNGSSWSEIDRDIISMNTSSTQVWFGTQTPIGSSPARDSNYYVYYGNPSAKNPPANRNNVYLWYDDFSTNTTLSYSIDRYASNWHGDDSNVYRPFWDPANYAVKFDTGDNYVGGWMPNAINETDVYAEMRMKITGSYPSNSTNGILLRWQNKTTYYGGDISGGVYQSPCLVKNQRDPPLKSPSTNEYHPWSQWFTLAVTVSGSNLGLFKDGVLKLNVTDNQITSPGKIVFLVAQAIGLMDDFKIRKYVNPEPTTSIGQEEIFVSGSLPPPNSSVAVELLQNGMMRWLGQNLNLTPNLKPIIPLPVKAIHVNQTTTNNVTQEVPYQIEDWASNYTIPLGLTNNASIFGGNNMLVFLANPSVVNVTIWWDGSETAIQTPNAYTCKYFTGDRVSAGTLTNGNLTLKVITASNSFTINSTLGGTENTAKFMRINSKDPTYGSDIPAFVISHGIVRDIIHQEPEWSGGVNGCPNLYAHVVLTLPANATYYTYQFRLMFVNSTQPRSISDLCLIQLRATIPKDSWGVPWGANQTEDGTSLGLPIVNYTGGFLYNASSIWEHHWSEFIGNNHGFGIMTTTQQNQQLYAIDNIGHVQTGGINITASINGNTETATIELKPVGLRSVSFTDEHDLVWYGAVATFEGQNPIYPDTGSITGLWAITEYCPTVMVTTST